MERVAFDSGGLEVEIRVAQQGLVTILSVVGPLIEEELAAVRDEIVKYEDQQPMRLVIDMNGVPFIDSVGLEWLQELPAELARRGGEVRVANLNEICKDIFVATRMGHFLAVSDNTESAVRSLL